MVSKSLHSKSLQSKSHQFIIPTDPIKIPTNPIKIPTDPIKIPTEACQNPYSKFKIPTITIRSKMAQSKSLLVGISIDQLGEPSKKMGKVGILSQPGGGV